MYVFDSIMQTLVLIKLADLIKLKLIVSLVYLILNYIVHTRQFPITLANSLRLLVGLLDFLIVNTLLFKYTLEWGTLAYASPAIGLACLVFIFGLNWVILLQQNQCVQPVFIIGLLSLAVLLMLNLLFLEMGLGYKEGTMPALMLFNGIYIFCWLIYYPNAQRITNFAEKVGEQLSWIDSLIGKMPHQDVALRNLCSFNLSLLNLTYIHTTLGGVASIITLILIGLGLLTNILIGLRLIKISASVKLPNSFMVQIIQHGYHNITTILMQLKNKQLPKATWYAWAITLTMGVTFISPCYAMTITGGEIVIDASLQGEGQFQDQEGTSSPVGEGSIWRRSLNELRNLADHNQQEFLRRVKSYPADLAYTTAIASAAGLAAYGGAQVGSLWGTEAVEHAGASTQTPSYDELAKANLELTTANAELTKTNAELVKSNLDKDQIINNFQKKSAWFGWFKGCFKAANNE